MFGFSDWFKQGTINDHQKQFEVATRRPRCIPCRWLDDLKTSDHGLSTACSVFRLGSIKGQSTITNNKQLLLLDYRDVFVDSGSTTSRLLTTDYWLNVLLLGLVQSRNLPTISSNNLQMWLENNDYGFVDGMSMISRLLIINIVLGYGRTPTPPRPEHIRLINIQPATSVRSAAENTIQIVWRARFTWFYRVDYTNPDTSFFA